MLVCGEPWVSRAVERQQNRAGHVTHLVERLPNVYKVHHSVFSIVQIRREGPRKPEGQKFVILNVYWMKPAQSTLSPQIKKKKRKKERKQSKDQAPPTVYFVSALELKTQNQGGIKRYKFKVKDQVEISAETSCPLQD